MRNILVIIIILLTISGCTRYDRYDIPRSEKFLGLINKDQFMPRAYRDQYFDHTPAPKNTAEARYNNDDESYERGFQDGCQTATSAIGSGLSRIRGHNVQGEELANNPWYLRGYQDASTFCTLSLDWEPH